MNQNLIIAKNTAYLYLRLIITSIVGLYSARLLILELGAEDFGLYVVIGSIVALFNVLNTTMINTTNRFIAIELGKNNEIKINSVFNQLLRIHLAFGIILLLLIETAGRWYVNNYLNIDASKIPSALFVLHTVSISTFFLSLSIPYQGILTAMEKFNVRSLLELTLSLLNLLAVALLQLIDENKIEFYALFILIGQVTIVFLYFYWGTITGKRFTKLQIKLRSTDYKSILRFFFWQLIYVFGSVGTWQGIVFLINRFFGTVINAAYGISARVNDLVYSFVKTLNQASMPQIVKNIGMGNEKRSLYLLYNLPRITFLIMIIPCVPLLIFLDPLISLWLKHVPEFTTWFIALRIIHGLISTLQSGFDATIDATGHIRSTKVFFAVLFLSIIPAGYYLFSLNSPPYFILIIIIFAEIIFGLFQLGVLSKHTDFSINTYYQESIKPMARIIILCSPLLLFRLFLPLSIINLFLATSLILIITTLIVFFIGLKKNEKEVILSFINKKQL
ncbi:MAG TPA: hypothetical protein PK990_08275 [Salinivirgaceae bacterium]|mgnify:CR=1 FL=1|nr:hypothetical protein [Salinivirgaceae bacterium]